jgi:hypothetical protein
MEPEETSVARQLLGKYGPAATNTHAAIELLDAVFSMQSVSYQITCSERKVGDWLFQELLVILSFNLGRPEEVF